VALDLARDHRGVGDRRPVARRVIALQKLVVSEQRVAVTTRRHDALLTHRPRAPSERLFLADD
jgi:hypothetical protein